MHVYWPSLWRWRDEEEEEGDEEGGGEKRGYTVRTWWRNSHCNPFSTLLNSFHLFIVRVLLPSARDQSIKVWKLHSAQARLTLFKSDFCLLWGHFIKINVWHGQDVTAPSPKCLERVSVLQPWTFLHHLLAAAVQVSAHVWRSSWGPRPQTVSLSLQKWISVQ